MKETLASAIKYNHQMQDDIKKGIEALQKALEVEMFYGGDTARVTFKLKRFLATLGIKSAREGSLTFGAPLAMESLEATLRSITFEEDQIKFWKDKVK
jgi:hypothetical protein